MTLNDVQDVSEPFDDRPDGMIEDGW